MMKNILTRHHNIKLTVRAPLPPSLHTWQKIAETLREVDLLQEYYLVDGCGKMAKKLGNSGQILSVIEINKLLNKFPNDTATIKFINDEIYHGMRIPGKETGGSSTSFSFSSHEDIFNKFHGRIMDAWFDITETPILGLASRTIYDRWQTTRDIEVYNKSYGPSDFFNKIPFGPPPVDFPALDISKNPGRRTPQLGKIREVGSEIWLGTSFWNQTTCTKKTVLEADFFIECRDTPQYLYLKSWHHPFTRPDGEQGRIQQKLWRLLFHEDCEWPPGSGGISDEPIGGPPEFMPPGILD
jgi:hypothetical protein